MSVGSYHQVTHCHIPEELNLEFTRTLVEEQHHLSLLRHCVSINSITSVPLSWNPLDVDGRE